MIDIVVEVVGTGGVQARGVHKYLVRRRSGSFKPLEFVWTDELRQDLEEVRKETPDRVRLEGEIATIAPVLPDVSIEERALADTVKQLAKRWFVVRDASSEEGATYLAQPRHAMSWLRGPLTKTGLARLRR